MCIFYHLIFGTYFNITIVRKRGKRNFTFFTFIDRLHSERNNDDIEIKTYTSIITILTIVIKASTG